MGRCAEQAGAAAVLCVQLCATVEAEVGGRCSQAREARGEESALFRSLVGGSLEELEEPPPGEGAEAAPAVYWRTPPAEAAPRPRLFGVRGGRRGCLGELTQLRAMAER